MKKDRPGKAVTGETLVDGLNHHERITLLENAVPKQWKQIEELRRQVADLTFEANRRRIWWPLRFFVTRKPEAPSAEN